MGGVAALLVLDYGLIYWLNRTPTPEWPAYRLRIDHLAHVIGDGLVLGCVGGLLWAGGRLAGWRAGVAAGRWTIGAVLIAGFWSQFAKLLIGRPRPRLWVFEGHLWPIGPHLRSSFDSFPSGHSATIFAVCCILAVLWPRGRTALLVLAALVALGRVYGGDHFLTDILVGSWLGYRVGTFAAERVRAEISDAPA